MLTLNDGRAELWQWDTGRKLTVDAECTQVHFSNKVFGRSIDVDVVDGVAIVPDILLQTDKELTAWAFVGTAENGYTKISKVFKVNKRNKPSDYVFTEQDQTTLGEILERIEDLENRPSADISKEDIQDAVNEYLDNNPVSVNETDPTVPDWAKQPEPPKVEIPDTLPNPHKLTFSGAVSAEYDGSKAVEVVIPQGDSGSSGGEWTKLGDITVADTYEFNPISFTGGVVTLDVNADGYSFMNQNRNVLFHPIDITSNIGVNLYQLRLKDYAAGTFDVYNLDGKALASESIDLTKYKMSVPNIAKISMTDIPDYDRYKVRFTFPAFSAHGIRNLFGSNVEHLGFGASLAVGRSGGVIMEHELFTFPYDQNYMVRRSTIVFGTFYGMHGGATHEAVTIVTSGKGKTHPVNGVVEFNLAATPFVNGSRFELWGANDV